MKKTSKKTKPAAPHLPEKQSALLRVAIEDVKKVERMKKTRRLDMDVFRVNNSDGTCSVCMAGAVMDRRLKIWETDELGGTVENKLFKIDCMRTGGTDSDDANALIQANYDENLGHAPWRIYEIAADILEYEGL